MIRIISNLFPKVHNPQYGIFIKEQADALSKLAHIDVVVLTSKFPALNQNWKNYADKPYINPDESLQIATCSILDFPKNALISHTLKQIEDHLSKLNWSEVNLVHIHYLYPGVLVTPFLIKNQIPFIIHIHGSDWFQFRTREKLKVLIDNALNGAKKILFSGKENFDDAQNEYGSKSIYLPNGVNFNEIDAIPKTDFYDSPTAICVANVTKVKGLHRLKRIANLKTKLAWRINVFGKIIDKNMKKDIEKAFEKSKHSIVFFDAQPKKTVLDEMRKSHVFLHTSEKEAFGIAVTEALYIGLPVIGTDTGILTSLPKLDGILKTDFSNDLRITDFLNKHDGSAKRYSSNSEIVQSYSLENYVNRLINIYSDVK